MASSLCNISTYSRFNLSASESDIQVFVKEYGYRIKKQFAREDEKGLSGFISFAEKSLSLTELTWLQDNEQRFMKDTPNENLLRLNYLSETGFISAMIYSPDGEFLIVGHSTGLIQVHNEIISEYKKSIHFYYNNEKYPKIWYPMYYQGPSEEHSRFAWLKENDYTFLKGTRNETLFNRWYCSELGAITALTYSPNGGHIIVGHASGMVQMRHGSTGIVLSTLRNIQFPPKPVYALEYSKLEERVCYAACCDGVIYRIDIPKIASTTDNPPEYCIRADPALECLNTQFYGSPGISTASSPFISQRSAALSLGVTADQTKIIAGYADTSIKVYDMETQEVTPLQKSVPRKTGREVFLLAISDRVYELFKRLAPDERTPQLLKVVIWFGTVFHQVYLTYKVHKLRLQFIPKKLQRIHFGQVCALRCHQQRPFLFATGAWDNTLRIFDIRCNVGCVMTFEGVNICADSIDLNRDHCIAGSWQPTEALSVWDLVAKKRLSLIRVQNRRPDVDGEYIYACRYWRSKKFNRKGKYGIIGGSGTNCVEIINLHNRYITCSYPAPGTILAITSHEEKIAFGGTAPVLNIVSFREPKHEKYSTKQEEEFEVTIKDVTWFDDDPSSDDAVEQQPQVKFTQSGITPALSKVST